MKVQIFQEQQGQGTAHGDPITGLCWCAQELTADGKPTGAAVHLKAKTREDAVKVAAVRFDVPETEIV